MKTALRRLSRCDFGAIAELERNLIVERVRAGMRRARLDRSRTARAGPSHPSQVD